MGSEMCIRDRAYTATAAAAADAKFGTLSNGEQRYVLHGCCDPASGLPSEVWNDLPRVSYADHLVDGDVWCGATSSDDGGCVAAGSEEYLVCVACNYSYHRLCLLQPGSGGSHPDAPSWCCGDCWDASEAEKAKARG